MSKYAWERLAEARINLINHLNFRESQIEELRGDLADHEKQLADIKRDLAELDAFLATMGEETP